MRKILAVCMIALLASSATVQGGTTFFDEFTPIPSSVAAGSLPEAAPFQLSSPNFKQRTIAERNIEISQGEFNSGAWDMHTSNETGPNKNLDNRM